MLPYTCPTKCRASRLGINSCFQLATDSALHWWGPTGRNSQPATVCSYYPCTNADPKCNRNSHQISLYKYTDWLSNGKIPNWHDILEQNAKKKNSQLTLHLNLSNTLIICSCTSSSVFTPWKHVQTVSTMRSTSGRLKFSGSGEHPRKCPGAISFWKGKNGDKNVDTQDETNS